jgi:hypothetical protein
VADVVVLEKFTLSTCVVVRGYLLSTRVLYTEHTFRLVRFEKLMLSTWVVLDEDHAWGEYAVEEHPRVHHVVRVLHALRYVVGDATAGEARAPM